METTSIVDYLNSLGKDSSLPSRAQLAVDNGLVSSTNEYMTLASQGKNADINTSLLTKLQTTPAAVPPAATGTPTPSTVSSVNQFGTAPLTGSQVEKGTTLPEPSTYVQTSPAKNLSDMVSEVAKTTMTANQLEIDNLRKQLESLNATELAAKKTEVAGLKEKVAANVGTTAAQDALKTSNEKFKVEENIKLYSDIQQRIVDAQQALNMGLIYEGDRPARMKFITGAESTLQKQGLATIGALQGTAAVIKGNLDLAKAYADSTINAINSDNEKSFKALTTLLDLSNNDLVSLTENERKLVNSRLDAIETQANTIQKNKDAVLELMTKYPKAFANGGVTLLDTREQALAKMLPTMAADEKAKFENDLKTTNAASVSARKAAQLQEDKALLLAAKANNMPYDEAILAFADTIPVADIAAIYGRKAGDVGGESAITDSYYNQFIDPATGKVKAGYSISIDPKTGRPLVEQTPAADGGWWGTVKSWFGK